MPDLKHHVKQVSKFISKAQNDLPEELFYFISSITPLTNVDLLIKNKDNQTLLTWRDDKYYGPGWHIPGGIIRFKETFATRISEVAKNELGIKVSHKKEPISIKELFASDRDIRGHFVSLLFECHSITQPNNHNKYIDNDPQNGQWAWHNKSPDNLIPVHNPYRSYIDEKLNEKL